ncbi:MAG: hypothetical protein J6T80_06240 [Paludibacteraceae bacterium]|nr:hypothetical protein [Paludibacteraceae bacterium]
MNKVCFNKEQFCVRAWLLSLVLFVSAQIFAGDGWTPSDCGLVVDLQPGDQILLSVMVDDDNNPSTPAKEYFVCDYPGYTGGYFNYSAANRLRLIPQSPSATEPSEVSVWTIDTALTRIKSGLDYALGGISYTMWSSRDWTLTTSNNQPYYFIGALSNNTAANNGWLCDVIFSTPTENSLQTPDPNNTLGRAASAGGKFNGRTGTGFLGMTYREVFMFDNTRWSEDPIAYVNSAVVTFNTSNGNKTWNGKTIAKGEAFYAYRESKHNATTRTLFRLYILNRPMQSCPDSYFFGYNEQDYKKYRTGPRPVSNTNPTQLYFEDSTDYRKTYTMDRLECMERVSDTKYYQCWMNVPESDSTYYYVGYGNEFRTSGLGSGGARSQFAKIETLPVQHLGLPAPRGAYGRMIVDTTSSADNLHVEFAPGGYFLRTNTGRNIRMRPNADGTIWTCEEMWHITDAYAALTIKATMFTGTEFSDDDEGADIPGWSQMVVGTSVPLASGGGYVTGGMNGWARIHINNTDPNGHMEFVLAEGTKWIHYDNNGCVGEQIPDQHPESGQTSVTVREPRLVGGFEFTEWNTQADGNGTSYHPGDVINNLPDGETTLYAIATYTGTYHVVLSFVKEDGKRYFLTHPGTAAPRFSRARHIDEWTDAYQGMANAENIDNHYINTFKLLKGPLCAEGEYVLDPRREMRYGSKDSLLFYENFAPAEEEYIGLYYSDPNTVIANTSWAGLFTSSSGWPNYSVADVQNTKLRSTHYLHTVADVLTRDERENSAVSYVKYNTSADQFDGEALEANATTFQISRVRVADEHYVVLPDTTIAWTDEITFGLHQGEQMEQQVWSKLIGKQLMALMKLGNDTVYFHPNRDKILTTANEFRLSADYRLVETFTYIRDSRATTLDASDETKMTETGNDFSRMVTTGMNSPMDVQYMGSYIDIVDTLRISLRTLGPVKIKEYYGRWRTGAPGVHVNADGSRYRDIIVRTKTYHYGATQSKLVLTPEFETYNFSPLANASKQLNFTLAKVSSRQLLDVDGNVMGEEILATEDVTSSLALGPGYCSFQSGGAYFNVINEQTVGQHVTLVTKADNNDAGDNKDTLIISLSVTIGGVAYPVTARVPLLQPSLENNEVVWSVVHDDQRYFIMAGSGGLIFRQYTLKNNILYKQGTTNVHLRKGSADAANSDTRYITPWKYNYVNQAAKQLTLETEYGIGKKFVIDGETPTISDASPSTLTYEYVSVNVNDNANFEELVRIKYGADKWLKFTVTGSTPSLSLTENAAEASVFSWSYLLQEYNLLNSGNYPDKTEAEFGYNSTSGVSISTRYKAYKEFSMLLDNTLTYCGREDETNIANLISAGKEWLTSYSIVRKDDSRFPANASGLNISTNSGNLQTTVTPSGDSPTEIRYPAGTGPYVNIVDTLDVTLSLQSGAPAYRFKDKWSSYTSVDDAHLKIPLIRKTYHSAPFDSLVCIVENDEYSHNFPSTIVLDVNDTHTFTLRTEHHEGTHVLDVNNNSVSSTSDIHDHTDAMHLDNPALAEIRLIDEYGNTPSWCHISGKTANTITVQCTANGIRAPRVAYLYLAYTMQLKGEWRYINFRLSVTQSSLFQYANNQTLIHSKGASGDSLVNGMQQVHTNTRILYYYPNQRVELPLRERGFYGWWRWFREGPGEIGDTDIPNESWVTPPTNVGAFNFPYRIIGDSVWIDENDHSQGKKLVTMGRYTVFHNYTYPNKSKYSRNDPPAKAPLVTPPAGKAVVTYAVDISNYYDNLPLSMTNVNQIDTAKLDTMTNIIEPTLSLREIFELHPWTEMAERMENYKSPNGATYPLADEKYMEDHVVMAPTGNLLLLSTEQRYNYANIRKGNHSESLMGYYMRDDNWETGGWDDARKDTMIWCAGWDADCSWYTYNPKTGVYASCSHPLTEGDDFLKVPAKTSITAGQEADTVYYCLRSRSKKSTHAGTIGDPDPVEPADGDYWFNICRYMVIYHTPAKYGPLTENAENKAIITNDEIEQNYEVLERLNFDYNRPGSDYQLYPHPLPWADASYGYTYPLSPSLPCNRFHNDFAPDLPNMGEYGLINKIGYSNYWYMMEQHGGAENGYMIYCDGMASAGQVAALSLESRLCEGQKMYFSGYVGNPATQVNKSCPNFLFSVQGSLDGVVWEDITSYMTGDIQPSNKWYQIFFPIDQQKTYYHFRVRVYNMASSNDGNDFIIDDMCVFATKPPLIAYQANTTCKNEAENDSLTHVVLRVDYQGFNDESYNGGNVVYTVEKVTKGGETSFMNLVDGYYDEHTAPAIPPATMDTVYGVVPMPARTYEPTDQDSVFNNLGDLILKFEQTLAAKEAGGSGEVFRQGYIYENLDGVLRPVMYIIHSAKMASDDTYYVRMAGSLKDLLGSICAMTSQLRVRNRMILELNGEEQAEKEVAGMCANTTYDVSLRVKGSLLLDNSAPIDLNGSCVNDWLLYGDTAAATSVTRYGYSYSDIVKVVKDILRCEPDYGTNANQFARNLAAVSRNEMERMMNSQNVDLETSDHPYDVLSHLVTNGFLTLYRSKLTVTTSSGDSIQYVIFPIIGTGSDAMLNMDVEVCPTPVFIKLKPTEGGDVPMTIGGFVREETEAAQPAVVLADVTTATSEIVIPIDSIMHNVALDTIIFLSTNDPEFLEGVHILRLQPDRVYDISSGSDNSGYYKNGDDLILTPSSSNNYQMRPGYSYTFGLRMMTRTGSSTLPESDCQVGTIPFVVSVVPDNVRWDPKNDENNQWNNPENWIGIDEQNQPLHQDAHFVPLSTTNVIIPTLADGLPYPELPNPESISSKDSVKQTGFQYNTCEAIRFMPGSAMGQQQRLAYTSAIVDMSMPQNKWALRSAPVTGMLSGDIFMSEADLRGYTSPWEVGSFDINGRNYQTGNASFWLSLYSRETIHKGNNDNVEDSTRTADAEWSKVTNVMRYSLPPAQGWAVYSRTASGNDAAFRLPKNDDIYYYYNESGDKIFELYEQNLQALRSTNAGGADKVGKLAFHPGAAATCKEYTLTNEAASTSFVFGNPTMGYIDIWGFIADNSGLAEEISYINSSGIYTTVTKSTAEATTNNLSNQSRYLPPMHAMVVTTSSGTELTVTLNTNRIVTKVSQVVRPVSPAPRRVGPSGLNKGIMTITAINPVSSRCTSRLLLGQGYHSDVLKGEDAMLTTLNIDHYTNTSTPATPFNIYASEKGYGLSIDLRDEVVNVPISFYMSNLPFGPVTQLWFTGVNNIDGELVLYDALTDSERPIVDGVCLEIETPESSHQVRYYIRRLGFIPGDSTNPIATDITILEQEDNALAVKIIKDGNVLILRNGEVYTVLGQKIR